jgi:O-antigen/teichoic acid export membrane protein
VRRLILNSGIYVGSALASAAIPFALLPVLTRALSARELGWVALFEACIAFCMPLVQFGVNGAVMVEFVKRKDGSFPSYLSSSLLIPLVTASLLSLVGMLALDRAGDALGLPRWMLLLVPFIAVWQTLHLVVLALLQTSERPRMYAMLQILNIATNFGVSVALVVGTDWQAAGRVTGILAGQLLSGAVALILLLHWNMLTFKVRREHFIAAVKFGAPLVPHALGGLVLIMADRFFIARLVGGEALGIYAVGFQIAMALTVVQNAVSQAWAPRLLQLLAESSPAADRNVVRSVAVVAAAFTACYFGLLLVTPWIFEWLIAPQFAASAKYVPILAGGFLFLGFYKLVVNIVMFSGRNGVLGRIALVNITIGLVANYVLVSNYGLYGAAFCGLLMNLVFFSLTLRAAQRIHPLPWFKRGAAPVMP